MSVSEPLRIASDVWWVGVRLPNDQFQCHAYLLEGGDDSVLIDPGSPLTIEGTLDLVQQICDLDSIHYLVCHHPDPDIAASLPLLSERLTRPDVQVVTEWRAAALLKHYGHRFDYFLVEEHDWALPLGGDRRLEFQLTPYLHFPGAMASFDPASRTLFSSDLFGGFVPDSGVLVTDDVDYVIENARPFHQHYMPSRELLTAGLTRIQHRWPQIDRIAPQHGHVIAGPAVLGAFEALKSIDCGVFALADADMDLKHLLRISQARTAITDALLTITDTGTLLATMNRVLTHVEGGGDVALFVDVPERGWRMWGWGADNPVMRTPPEDAVKVPIPGSPHALLCFQTAPHETADPDLLAMLTSLAPVIRPAIDEYLQHREHARRESDLRAAAWTDPLTGLGNRRALEAALPQADYALLAFDIDHFKSVNDTYGHQAGDAVLSQVSSVIAGSIRADDRAYRLGGEEFLAVLPGSDLNHAKVVAERIRTRVTALDLSGLAPGGRITVSVGVAVAHAATIEGFRDVLSRADSALYTSKEAGRDRVTVAV